MAQSPKVKFDLSQTVREVAELNKALETLGGISQNLFSNLGRLSQTFGSTIKGVSQQITDFQQTTGGQQGAGPSAFMTAVGQQQATAADQDLRKRFHEAKQGIASGEVYRMGDYYRQRVAQQGGNYIKKVISVSDYNRIQNHGFNDAVSGAIGQQAAAGPSPQFGPMPQAAPGMSAAASQFSMDAIGVGMGDVTRQMRLDASGASSKGMDQISASIDKLTMQAANTSGENARLMRDTARILESLKDQVRSSSDEFQKASQKFSDVAHLAPSDPARQRAEQELLAATGRRSRSQDQLEQAQQEANQILGGGGGGSRGGRFLRSAGKALGGAAAIVGGGLGIYSTYLGLEQGFDQATYQATLQGQAYLGQRAQAAYQTTYEQADMTRAENLLKYRADLLYPDQKFKFIGTRGMERAIGQAEKDETQRRSMEQRGRTIDLLGGIGRGVAVGAALGAGIGATGAGIGAIPGALLGAAGGLLTSGMDAARSYFANPYTAFSGGLEDSTIGRIVGGKGFASRAAEARRREDALSNYNVVSNARDLMNAELAQNPTKVRALQEVLDMEQAEQYAASLVGGDALTQSQILGMYRDVASSTGTKEIVDRKNAHFREMENTNRSKEALRKVRTYERYQKLDKANVFQDAYKRDTEAGFFGSVFENDADAEMRKSTASRADRVRRQAALGGITEAHYKESLGVLKADPESAARAAELLDEEKRSRQWEFFKKSGRNVPAELALARGADIARQAARQKHNETITNRTPTRAETIFANLQLTPSEYIQRQAEFSTAINERADLGSLNRSIRLGRAGFGNFGQLMENITQIGATAGGRGENLDRLERVLAQAVSIGFDKSRMAQSFVRTTTQLAESTRSRNVEEVAQRLGIGASYLGVNVGKADELSMRLTSQGIQGYEAFTRQTSGAVGAFKAMGLMQAGATPGANLFSTLGMGAQEMTNALTQLQNDGQIVDPKIKQMLAIEKVKLRDSGFTGNIDTAARSNLRSKLKGPLGQLNDLNKEMVKSITGVDVNKMFEGIKNTTGAERDERIQAYLGQFGAMGEVSGMGREAGQIAALDTLRERGIIQRKDFNQYKNQLNRNIEKGNRVYRDEGKVQLRKYIDSLIIEDVAAEGLDDPSKTRESLSQYFSKGGAPMEIAGQRISSMEQYDQLRKSGAIGNISRLDLARAAEFTANLGDKVQSVRITNFYEINRALGQYATKIRENARNGGNFGTGSGE